MTVLKSNNKIINNLNNFNLLLNNNNNNNHNLNNNNNYNKNSEIFYEHIKLFICVEKDLLNHIN